MFMLCLYMTAFVVINQAPRTALNGVLAQCKIKAVCVCVCVCVAGAYLNFYKQL